MRDKVDGGWHAYDGVPVFGRAVETKAEAMDPPGLPLHSGSVEVTAAGQVRDSGLNMSTPATRRPVFRRAVETEAVEIQEQNERDGDHARPKGKNWVERKGGKRQRIREMEAAAVRSTKTMLPNTVSENARAAKDWKAVRRSAELALQFDIYVSGSTSMARICGRHTTPQYFPRNGSWLT